MQPLDKRVAETRDVLLLPNETEAGFHAATGQSAGLATSLLTCRSLGTDPRYAMCSIFNLMRALSADQELCTTAYGLEPRIGLRQVSLPLNFQVSGQYDE
jgi:hypothetical protein